ncbi:MAG: hypothetical protein COV79_01425 [Parcubacteria group bacterium CG11_big_fil_rev_8_21_14_0_20_41_14]|nr:MAG: hypothetical protein COV79_01425 [Parcubacteria group bacterium CG11_big_fil_rev_8_21_14_0_20_41_14]PIR56925.1 MAG: hypothetical protein COU72_03645 [Parcubacteria group bacterium CG10_big_fil_rev_8_21_14_0_10_41_35]PIZ81355.1 MAG: hypothetical protein COY02_02490 [Parcubacteria group bacterium CG_4_10_14_0_2_um_filter_41_6]
MKTQTWKKVFKWSIITFILWWIIWFGLWVLNHYFPEVSDMYSITSGVTDLACSDNPCTPDSIIITEQIGELTLFEIINLITGLLVILSAFIFFISGVVVFVKHWRGKNNMPYDPLGHIKISVSDIAKSKEFYSGLFQKIKYRQVVNEKDCSAWVSAQELGF